MSKTLSEITPGSIVWFNTTLSGSNKSTPFIVLGPSKQGNSILLLQKYAYEQRAFHSANVSEYSTSTVDKYLSADATTSDSYRSKISEDVRNCLVKTTIGSYSYSSGSTIELSRDIFLMACTEAGYSDSKLTSEGDSYLSALKVAAGTTVDANSRITTTESNTAVNWLLRSPYNSSSVKIVGGTGASGWFYSINGACYIRPVLSIAPTTLVDDSSSTLSLLPTSTSHNIDITISMGQSVKRPIKAKVSMDIKHVDSKIIQVTNNYKDTNPVWVTVNSDGFATLSNSTKTTDQWELGMKINTKSVTAGTVICEPALIIITE